MRPRSLAALLLLLTACAPEPREPEPLVLETVEVGDTVDAGLSTEEDPKQRHPVGGDLILPADFPPGLPVPEAARLVGSGDAPGERTFLLLHTVAESEALVPWYRERLAAGGWRVEGGGSALTAERGGRRVDLAFGPMSPGTEVRVEY